MPYTNDNILALIAKNMKKMKEDTEGSVDAKKLAYDAQSDAFEAARAAAQSAFDIAYAAKENTHKSAEEAGLIAALAAVQSASDAIVNDDADASLVDTLAEMEAQINADLAAYNASKSAYEVALEAARTSITNAFGTFGEFTLNYDTTYSNVDISTGGSTSGGSGGSGTSGGSGGFVEDDLIVGALVVAQDAGGTVVTVQTNANGEFQFPAGFTPVGDITAIGGYQQGDANQAEMGEFKIKVDPEFTAQDANGDDVWGISPISTMLADMVDEGFTAQNAKSYVKSNSQALFGINLTLIDLISAKSSTQLLSEGASSTDVDNSLKLLAAKSYWNIKLDAAAEAIKEERKLKGLPALANVGRHKNSARNKYSKSLAQSMKSWENQSLSDNEFRYALQNLDIQTTEERAISGTSVGFGVRYDVASKTQKFHTNARSKIINNFSSNDGSLNKKTIKGMNHEFKGSWMRELRLANNSNAFNSGLNSKGLIGGGSSNFTELPSSIAFDSNVAKSSITPSTVDYSHPIKIESGDYTIEVDPVWSAWSSKNDYSENMPYLMMRNTQGNIINRNEIKTVLSKVEAFSAQDPAILMHYFFSSGSLDLTLEELSTTDNNIAMAPNDVVADYLFRPSPETLTFEGISVEMGQDYGSGWKFNWMDSKGNNNHATFPKGVFNAFSHGDYISDKGQYEHTDDSRNNIWGAIRYNIMNLPSIDTSPVSISLDRRKSLVEMLDWCFTFGQNSYSQTSLSNNADWENDPKYVPFKNFMDSWGIHSIFGQGFLQKLEGVAGQSIQLLHRVYDDSLEDILSYDNSPMYISHGNFPFSDKSIWTIQSDEFKLANANAQRLFLMDSHLGSYGIFERLYIFAQELLGKIYSEWDLANNPKLYQETLNIKWLFHYSNNLKAYNSSVGSPQTLPGMHNPDFHFNGIVGDFDYDPTYVANPVSWDKLLRMELLRWKYIAKGLYTAPPAAETTGYYYGGSDGDGIGGEYL